MQYHEFASGGCRLTCAPLPSGLSYFLIYGPPSLLPRQLKVSSSSSNQCLFFHPMCSLDTDNRHSSGLVTLCTLLLCPGSHQLLRLGCSQDTTCLGKWHPWAVISQDEQNKIIKKKLKICLAKLDHSFTVVSKENVSGTPSYSSKFIAFLQDHLINCSLCTADIGEQVSGAGVGKSEAILISPLYLVAAICTWIIGISMEHSQSPLLLCMLNSSFTCTGREELGINIQPANKQGLHKKLLCYSFPLFRIFYFLFLLQALCF